MRWLSVFVLMLNILAACTPGQEENQVSVEIPSYLDEPLTVVAEYVDEPLKMDGVLDESIYTHLLRLPLDNSQTGAAISDSAYYSFVQVAYDKTHLYLAYTCYDRDIHTRFTQRDERLFEEEAVEVFIDVDTVPRDYVEIEISPANVLYDSWIVDPENIDVPATSAYDMDDFQSGVSVKGTLNERSDQDSVWTVEMAIPLRGLLADFSWEKVNRYAWKINFYRLNLDEYGPRAFAWSPTEGSFHQPALFGVLRFSRPEYRVREVGIPPQLDGSGEDPAWAAAEVLTQFAFPWQDRPAPHTEFRALWDSEALYFQFRVEDADLVLAEAEAADMAAVRSDRVELFFAVNDSLAPYYSLEMDPQLRVFDAAGHLYRKIDPSWDWPGLETFARIGEQGYVLEGRIPMASFNQLELWQEGPERALICGVFRAEFDHLPGDSIRHNWITWVWPDAQRPDFHIPSAFGKWVLEASIK